MTAAKPPIKIAIIGAGIAGLSLAASLQSHPHLQPEVYESVPSFRHYGSGLAMHANAMQGLGLLGPAVLKAYTQRSRSVVDDDELELATQIVLGEGPQQGTVVVELGRAKARKCISRFDLLTGLAELIPWERLHFGKKVVRIEEPVDGNESDGCESDGKIVLHFRDGTRSEVDCVIGADGVYSYVRQHLLGLDDPASFPKNHSKWALYHAKVPVEEVRDLIVSDRLIQPAITCGSAGCCVLMPLNRGRDLSISFMQQAAYGEAGTEPFDKTRYNKYSQDVKALAKLVEMHVEPPWVIQDHDPARFYNRRRVVMMGDAAHATFPFNGQGAAQAIEDAAVLKALFADIDDVSQISKAFEAFDIIRRPRSQKVAQISRDFGQLYVFKFEDIKDDPQRMKQYLGPRGQFTNAFDLKDQNEAALKQFRDLLGED